jgi:hypothetical protein
MKRPLAVYKLKACAVFGQQRAVVRLLCFYRGYSMRGTAGQCGSCEEFGYFQAGVWGLAL